MHNIDLDGLAAATNAPVRGKMTGKDTDEAQDPGQELAGLEFERNWKFGTACTTFRKTLNYVGAFCALLNQGLDVVYAFRTQYALASMFSLTCVFLALRIVATIVAG